MVHGLHALTCLRTRVQALVCHRRAAPSGRGCLEQQSVRRRGVGVDEAQDVIPVRRVRDEKRPRCELGVRSAPWELLVVVEVWT